MRYKKKPIKEEEKRRKQQMREERVPWYNKIETKKVVCLSCGQTFLTRIEPYYREHKYCLSCVEDKDRRR